jgi:lysophospholipase L1-like esterase
LFTAFLFIFISAFASVRIEAASVGTSAVKNGDKIAFLGDSISANGARPDGYVTLVMDALRKEGLEVSHVPAGISGHRSNDMLARLDRDVLSKKPQWLLLSCGVNDVWHFKLHLGKRTFQGVPLDDYKKNVTEIIDKAQAAGIKVMILTATMIGEDPERELNKNLIPYNDFLREIAKGKKCLLADLNKDMQEELRKIPDVKGSAKMFGEPDYKRDIKNKLTVDGCHMNRLGNIMMAKGILRAFGFGEAKISSLEESWLKASQAPNTGKAKGPGNPK